MMKINKPFEILANSLDPKVQPIIFLFDINNNFIKVTTGTNSLGIIISHRNAINSFYPNNIGVETFGEQETGYIFMINKSFLKEGEEPDKYKLTNFVLKEEILNIIEIYEKVLSLNFSVQAFEINLKEQCKEKNWSLNKNTRF